MRVNALKRYGILVVKFSIAVGIGWYLLKHGFLTKNSFIALFTLYNLPFVALSAFAFIGNVLFSTGRLILLLRIIGLNFSFFQGFKLTMIGFFFNLVLPGVIGGDVVKGYYLIKHEEHSRGRSSGVVVIDRILGILALMMIGVVSILYLLHQHSDSLRPYHNTLYLVCLIIGSIMTLFAAFLFLGNNKWLRGKLQKFFTIILRRSILYHIVDSFGILVKHHRVLFFSFLLSLLIHLASLGGLFFLGKMLHPSFPDLISVGAIFALVLLFGIVPITPGNIGWTELLAAHGLLAVGSSAGAEIFLYWRIITALCSLPGGLFYLLTSKNKKQMLRTQRAPVTFETPTLGHK